MSSVRDLKDALTETLEARGVLGDVKARLRAEIFQALNDDTESCPALSRENLLINELIREYLEYNKYKYTLSTMLAETGQPRAPLDRDFLAGELHIAETGAGRKLPLLYAILADMTTPPHPSASASPAAPSSQPTRLPPSGRTTHARPGAMVLEGQAGH